MPMSAARKMGMLLASLLALLAFFGQANARFAEHAGLIPCHEAAADSSSDSDDLGEGHCCHVEASAVLDQAFPAVSFVFQTLAYPARAFEAPDGPVEDIDYPPQLRS